MYQGKRVAVVIPAYNEERQIIEVINTMPDLVDQIVIVDDCSKDQTKRVVAEMNHPRVTLLSTPQNSGVGGAMLIGYKHALTLDADFVVKMDGDGQMLPEYLPQLLDALVEGFDYAKGNRFLFPEFLPQMPKVRLFGNVALTFMTKMATGYWHIFDPQNGYTAIRVGAVRCVS